MTYMHKVSQFGRRRTSAAAHWLGAVLDSSSLPYIPPLTQKNPMETSPKTPMVCFGAEGAASGSDMRMRCSVDGRSIEVLGD
jgi:hypothetical protein